MKITFIAEHGVEVRSVQIGADDYEDPSAYRLAVHTEHDRQWADGAAVGYEEVFNANQAKVEAFVAGDPASGGAWLEWLSVPYGYLVLSK